ncbi:hypothetical protein HZA33_04135 [Candidatus Pacearchaeota archaeon]|nr:hypothetical protein [Candidatus Pacearchaeota archaeon]
MKILEYHLGCNAGPQPQYCMGPWNDYYTLFGTELRFLKMHLFISVIIGIIIFLILNSLIKKGKIRLSTYVSIIISLIAMILVFLLSAYLLPIRVLY